MAREDFNPYTISDLPAELVRELCNESSAKKRILHIFKLGGGTLNISEVLVGLYRTYGETQQRTYVVGVLYRLRKQGLVFPTGRKGEYTLERGK